MKGIILAGGSGSRLFPITHAISKQLIPVFDKPMIYYPLSILFLSEIREILIITTEEDIESYKKLLGNGNQFGVNFFYAVQKNPNGLAEAFILGKDFIGEDSVCLILGDNIFYGSQISPILLKAKNRKEGATVFAYHVNDPSSYGVVEFDSNNIAISVEEKPIAPKSEFAITGLYYYDNEVVEISNQVVPSARGELEISSINQVYLNQNKLNVEILGRGVAWLDTGTNENLLRASQFVETVQSRQGFKIACLEEIAWQKKWINDEQLLKLGEKYIKNEYGQYLLNLKKNLSVK